MCMSERRMNNLSQMHVFDLFPWMEGGNRGEIPASSGVSSLESINSLHIYMLDAQSFLHSLHLLLVDNVCFSDINLCQCANCVDGVHMLSSIQFYLHLFESAMSVGAFQKACWDWDLLHIRMETRPRLKLLM